MEEKEWNMNIIPEPIFIICTGRSGSTLLRYILDGHELIDAPQELHLGPMIKEMIRIVLLLHEGRVQEGTDMQKLVQSEVRSQIETIMRASLKSEIWCDKSVSSIDYLDEFTSIFPKAKYIFLYRDCLDFVHSALEASKYGFDGFWFEDFILKNPENIVDGLVNFWCMQTEKRISLKEQSNFEIHSIKYEDIVNEPIPTMQVLFDFLNLVFDEKILDNIFSGFRHGKGDIKVQSSSRIVNNIGKGKDVPLKFIEEETFLRMNKVLKQIGYPEVDREYGFSKNEKYDSEEIQEISKKRLYDYLNSRLEKKSIPTELEGVKVSFDISDIEDRPWLIDMNKRCIEMNYEKEQDASLIIKIRIDSLLKIMDKKLNISLAFRQGYLKIDGTPQQLNEVGRFLFG